LEHLIFMGSEKYPYKGVLDVLANRCFAQGTNAWTDVDHTCYTVDTAGSEGFLRILPVYLDHVLFPTLTEESFITEIHHITEEGADAGVVYCEMQARENEADDMMEYACKQALYPGRCSYKSETGGRLKELRELKNQAIRDYHTAYYRPENLCVIVTGQIDYKELCEAVAPVVDSILNSEKIKALPPFQRPFASQVPKPEEAKEVCIEFPAEDESSGAMVDFAWLGPLWKELQTIQALRIFLMYLTQDAVAPLHKALVDTLPALCGRVGFDLYEQTTYLIKLSLKSVDNSQLSSRDVKSEVIAVLKSVAADNGAGIDLDRIKSLVGQVSRQHFNNIEGNPHDLYSGHLIGAFMYAPGFAPDAKAGDESSAALRERLDAAASLDPLLKWSAAQWAELCNTWLLGPTSSPCITVIGTPSKSYGERIQADDAERIAAQKEALGEDGCKAESEKVAAAEEKNDMETPEEVVQACPLPDASKISLIEVSTVRVAGGKAQPLRGPEADAIAASLPAFTPDDPLPTFQLDHAAGFSL
jgi:Zn-dependent M16 (insulinase) family peptidase